MRRALISSAALLVLTLPIFAASQEATSSPVGGGGALPAGVVLPRTGTVYILDTKVLDTKATGPALVQLHPAEIVSNSHAAGNFARSMVYVGARASFELKGLNAPTSLETRQPSILVHINGDDPELLRNRVRLIHLQQTKDRRVVSNFSQNVFGGQRTKKFDDVPVTKTDVEPDVWLKLTPEQPLAPGEYGVVFMPKDTNAWPDAVYDFDVAIDAAKPEK